MKRFIILDDDNNEGIFFSETGECGTQYLLTKMLCKPHIEEFKLKYINMGDVWAHDEDRDPYFINDIIYIYMNESLPAGGEKPYLEFFDEIWSFDWEDYSYAENE